jgi:ketosteroid isomerase-like protein
MTRQEVIRTRVDDPGLDAAPSVDAEEALSLPPSSPARRAFLRGFLVEAIDAANRGDLDSYLAMFHPDVGVRIARLETGGLWGGDFDELYEGREGLRRLMEQWLEVWDEIRLDPHEILDEGGDSFVALGEWVGTGRGSGVEVRTPWPARITLRGRLVARVDFFPSPDVALAAMGLDG